MPAMATGRRQSSFQGHRAIQLTWTATVDSPGTIGYTSGVGFSGIDTLRYRVIVNPAPPDLYLPRPLRYSPATFSHRIKRLQ
jgi:hypothetical protein